MILGVRHPPAFCVSVQMADKAQILLGEKHTLRLDRNFTVSSVLSISGILSRRPTARRRVFASMY